MDGGSFAVVGAVAGAATDGSVIGAFAGAAGAGTGVVGEMIGFSKTDCGTLFGEDGVTEVVDGGAGVGLVGVDGMAGPMGGTGGSGGTGAVHDGSQHE